MDSASDRLESLRVADVMTRKLITLRVEDSIAEAARRFVEQDISAAPVIDGKGRCVGIVTLRDLLGRAFAQRSFRADEASAREARDDSASGETFAGGGQVGHVISGALQTIAPELGVLAAARIMCVQHAHRLVVLDHEGRVLGLVSSMDVVSTLVNAMDEMHDLASPKPDAAARAGQGS